MRDAVVSKINKIGKVGRIISKISKIMIVIGFVCCIVASVFLMVLPRNLVTITISSQAVVEVDNFNYSNIINFDDLDVDAEIDLNGLEFEIEHVTKSGDGIEATTEVATNRIYLRDFVWVLGLGMMAMAAVYVALHFVEKLCQQFEVCQTPFTDEIVKGIRLLAISLIPMSLLNSTVESITNTILSGDIDIVVGVDLMAVLYILLIFMLASIFKYGTMLQKESDELL